MNTLIEKAHEAGMTSTHLLKGTGDISGLIVLGLAFMEVVPMAAAIFTMIWMFFRMIETGVRFYRLLFTNSVRRYDDAGEDK